MNKEIRHHTDVCGDLPHLGGPYEHGPKRRRGSYLATVVTDLATLIPGEDTFYTDVINEFLAVGISPQLLVADEHAHSGDQTVPAYGSSPRLSTASRHPTMAQ